MIIKYSIVIYLACILFNVSCETLGGRMYTRYPSCREHDRDDDAMIEKFSTDFVSKLQADNKEILFGTIGILGGAWFDSGAAYFAAMAALRVGANSVHIFCTKASAPAILAKSPDINVYPIVDTDWKKVYQMISTHDVVLIGPGLDENQHSINVINALVPHCKKLKKPIVFDLSEYFLSLQFINLLVKYPSPGIILTTNTVEFEKIYPHIKSKNAYSEFHVNIDFQRMGSNLLIYRKGCTDMAMTKLPVAGWSLSRGGSPRRSSGQGSVISGITAILYYRALKMIPEKDLKYYGRMLPASIATYSAAKLVRDCNKIIYIEKNRSGITSDIVNHIGETMYPPPNDDL